MNAPKVSFNITNLSFSVASILKGISCVEGITLRGPFAKPELLITSWAQFLKVYGGYITNSDFPLLCKRAFDRGAQLRVSRVGHYTTITNASSLDAVKAAEVAPKIITFDAALVTANVYNLTINGTPIAPVTFATDSDTTMAAIATAIKAVSTYVSDAFVIPVTAGVTNDRVIMVFPKTTSLVLTASAVTLGASQAGTAITSSSSIVSAANVNLFNVAPKYAGVDYNNLTVIISAASNGNANYFNMSIVHALDSTLTETYSNLIIPGNPTVNGSTYLDEVKNASQLLDFTYLDLSATVGQQRPVNETFYFNSGSDGTVPVALDYVGDSGAKNGFYAFDVVDDALQIAAPEMSDNTIHLGGSAYTAARKDLVYFAHLANSNTTAATLITARQTTNIDSLYTAFFAGGLQITDPVTGATKNISEIGDILGVAAYNDSFAVWFSMAGVNRGLISNALGVVNNFGGTALYNNLNQLANAQVNMVIVQDNQIYLNGNYSAVLANSKLSFLNAVRFIIYLQKSLAPTLRRYLQEPGDIPAFKALYREVEPFLNDLITGRAIFEYSWQGDQDAKSLDDLQINNTTDLDNGKYKVRLFLKIVGSLQEIVVDITVTSTGVSFEQA